MGLAARWAAQDRYALRTRPGPLSEITFPSSPLSVKGWIALGANPAAHPLNWAWHEISEYIRYRPGVSIIAGRRDESSVVQHSTARLTLDNRDGRFTRRNPSSPYYGLLSRNTPIRLAVDPGDGDHIRFEGYVNEWPKRWPDKSGNDLVVPIVCGGLLRRLQQTEVSQSCLRRTILSVSPGSYWPLEDSSGSTSAASAVHGQPRMQIVSGTVDFATDSDVVGSKSLPNVSAGMLHGDVTVNSSTIWYCEFLARTAFLSGVSIAQIHTNSAGFQDIYILPPSAAGQEVEVAVFDSAEALVVDILGDPVAATWENEWHLWTLIFAQNGGNIDYEVLIDNVSEVTGSVAATNGQPIDFYINPDLADGAADSFGHIVFGTGTDATSAAGAMDGFDGEKAHVRIQRVCDEESITYTSLASDSEFMGPQSTGGLLTVLREAEKADLGVLYEVGFGLGYQSRLERYNQSVGLALDFDQGHIAETPQPDDDDQRYRNQWTVSRPRGSEATFTDEDRVAEDGPVPDEDSANVAADAQLLNQASWRVGRDTVDEDRWNNLEINLARSPDLIAAWTSLGYGARVTAANPPDEVTPETIDAVIEGHTEFFNTHEWRANLSTSPASVYDVGVYAESTDTGPSRYSATVATLAAEFIAGTDTSMSVATGLGPIWTTTAAYLPFDIEVEGVVLTVTAIAGASSPQTFTITQTPVNGVAKTLPVGSSVEFDQPSYYGH